MRYLGMDVHGKATVFCLLDADGKTVETGSVPTTAPALSDLAQRLSKNNTLVAAQEIGTMCQFVHDVFTAAGVTILSFNAQQLRVIASSRKKTDKRDSFWIAKSLQTGMMSPFVPSGVRGHGLRMRQARDPSRGKGRFPAARVRRAYDARAPRGTCRGTLPGTRSRHLCAEIRAS